MSVLEVVTVGHPVLRERASDLSPDELASPEVQGFIDDMIETMRAASGAGLAANQVGCTRRTGGGEVPDGGNPLYPYKPPIPLTVMVNPVIEPLGPETLPIIEGCLSVPALRGELERFAAVRVRYLDRHGEAREDTFE